MMTVMHIYEWVCNKIVCGKMGVAVGGQVGYGSYSKMGSEDAQLCENHDIGKRSRLTQVVGKAKRKWAKLPPFPLP